MAVGHLYLDPKYIDERHWNLKWSDQPENSRVNFHFDPNEVKMKVGSKWSPGNKDTEVDGELEIPWKWEKGESPNTISVKLMFTDFVGSDEVAPGTELGQSVRTDSSSVNRGSTQRSLEILEAMALPINEKWYEELDQDVVGSKFVSRHTAWTRDPKKPLDLSKVTHWVEVTRVTGTRLVDHVWHPPRPLVLKLLTPETYKCVILKLAIDFIAMDNITGTPTVAQANVTFAEWPEYVEGTGLVVPKGANVEQITTLDEWTRKVNSGEVRQKTRSKTEITRNYLKKKDKPTAK